MAENQRKVAEPLHIDDEDPFAELTRIMGFDPRVPVQPKELVSANSAGRPAVTPAAPVVAVPAAQPARDDFEIDLEKELLGGFDDFDLPTDPVPAVPAARAAASDIDWAPAAPVAPVARAASDSVDARIDHELDRAFADIDDLDPMEAELAAAADSAIGDDLFERALAEEIDGGSEPGAFDVPSFADDAFDDAIAAELDRHTAEARLPSHDATADLLDAMAAELEQQPVRPAGAAPVASHAFGYVVGEALAARAASQGSVEPVIEDESFYDAVALKPADHAAQPADDEPNFDLGDFDLNLHPHDEGAVSVAQATLAEPSKAEAGAHPSEPEFDLGDFDLHLHAHDEAPVSVAQATPAEPAQVETNAHIAEPEFDLGDFDLHLHPHDEAPVAVEPAHAPEPATTVSPATVAEPVDALADVDMDFTAAFELDADGDEEPEPAAALAAAEPAEPAPAEPAEFELSLEDELHALLEGDHDLPQVQASAAASPMPVAPERERSRFLSDSRWAALEADEEDEPVIHGSHHARPAARAEGPTPESAEVKRPFGDTSLTSRHANFPLPQTPALQPVEDLDDLLDQMEHEVHAVDPAPAGERQPAPTEAASAEVGYTYGEPAAYHGAGQPFAEYEDEASAAGGLEAAPEIETVDVPEAVAIADDLDIPELAYQEDERQTAAYDDIDADFAANFNETVTSEEPVNQAVRGMGRPTERADIDAEFEALYSSSHQQAAPAAADQGYHQPVAADDRQDEQSGDYEDFSEGDRRASAAGERFVDLDFDGDMEEEIAPAVAGRQVAERPQRRGLLVAGVVGAVALLGGVGALALTFGSGDAADVPVLVKADDSPVKVKPENPGGTTVPNQDNRVYDAVKGSAAAAEKPAQEKLVTSAEEPVDMAAVDQGGDPLPGVETVEDVIGKAEDRVDPVADADQDPESTDSIAVAPRKVKTMVVRADGTLVPREEPTTTASAEPALAPANDETATVAAAEEEPSFQTPGTGDAVPVKSVKSTKVTLGGQQATDVPAKPVRSTKVDADGKPTVAAAEESALPPANMIEEAPAAEAPEAKAAEAKPAEAKPEESKPEEVAVANVEPVAVAAGAWSVQIASQPSAESAKSTYEDLASRFGSVIGGRGVNIVKAEIQGKGTYWRVRVPAKSRNDAIDLCTDYKSAGGNCFVSK
jgi:hypothetical protein